MRRKKKAFPWALTLPLAIILVIGAGIYLYQLQQQSYNFPFPCVGQEQTLYHVHPYLRIVINGQNITIPANIGIIGNGSCFEPVHTHDSSGIIHIESSTNTNYTLGDFFQIWKDTYNTVTFNGTDHPIVFNSTDILGFKADQSHKVILLVDGKVSNEYQNLVLNTLDYCTAQTTSPPCYPTAVGNPYWGGAQYPYGTGHTIVIEYVKT